jgi:hypothetical protein
VPATLRFILLLRWLCLLVFLLLFGNRAFPPTDGPQVDINIGRSFL